MKSLIVYYSRKGENYFGGSIKNIKKGNTEVVAEKIQKYTNGDMFELVTEYDYSKDYMTCTEEAKDELHNQARPKFLNPLEDISSYDVIYVGYPNWWGTYPRVVATFLESYNFDNKIIKPFCTHEGSGMGSSEGELKRTLKNSDVKQGLAIRGSSVLASDSLVEGWVIK